MGRPKHVRLMAGALEGDTFIGPKAEVGLTLTNFAFSFTCLQEHRGLMKLKYPIEHGIVQDWNDMEKVHLHGDLLFLFD